MDPIIVEQSGIDCSFPISRINRFEILFVEIYVKISMLFFFFLFYKETRRKLESASDFDRYE